MITKVENKLSFPGLPRFYYLLEMAKNKQASKKPRTENCSYGWLKTIIQI